MHQHRHTQVRGAWCSVFDVRGSWETCLSAPRNSPSGWQLTGDATQLVGGWGRWAFLTPAMGRGSKRWACRGALNSRLSGEQQAVR